MRAVRWLGPKKVDVGEVEDPAIIHPSDAIVRVTLSAICGSDLHLYNGLIPTMQTGDILGHEFMGEVVAIGADVQRLQPGDRVVVPFCIGCGACWYCRHDLWSFCDNSNPNAWMAEKLYGYSGAGLFGYSHLLGGYAGGQAQYVRVPFADSGPLKIESALSDDQVLFLSDIFPTGYMAAENCAIQEGDVIAIWGCGPVGQFAIRSAFLLGAQRVIAIDRVPERLAMAQEAGAETLHHDEVNVLKALDELTAGRGPDACIDAVGMEAHGPNLDTIVDKGKQRVRLVTDRAHTLRQAIHACGKGGVVSIPGVYGGYLDSMPMGAAFDKGLTFRMGQTHCQRYMRPLLEIIERGEIDPSFVVTHRCSLEDAPDAYKLFASRKQGCVKVVLTP